VDLEGAVLEPDRPGVDVQAVVAGDVDEGPDELLTVVRSGLRARGRWRGCHVRGRRRGGRLVDRRQALADRPAATLEPRVVVGRPQWREHGRWDSRRRIDY